MPSAPLTQLAAPRPSPTATADPFCYLGFPRCFACFLFKIPHINQVWHLPFFAWLTSLIITSFEIHLRCHTWHDFLLFYGLFTVYMLYIYSSIIYNCQKNGNNPNI